MEGVLQQLTRPKAPLPSSGVVLSGLTGILLLLLAWGVLSDRFAKEEKAALFPSPIATWNRFCDYLGYGPDTRDRIQAAKSHHESRSLPWTSRHELAIREQARDSLHQLGTDLRTSIMRVTLAFFLAAVLAIPLGIAMGTYAWVDGLLQPVAEFVRYIPVPALIPLLIILFGVDEAPKVLLIFLGTFSQLLLMVGNEVKQVPESLLRACYCLGGTHGEAVSSVIMKQSMPGIFDALRMCNGWAWTWLIVAELVAADAGMGFRIIRFQRYLQTDQIFLYLVALGLLGLAVDRLFHLLNRQLFPWRGSVDY
ncbi:MAG: ABC transporter permease [Opitutales bacterium]|nr:ABC transporter permease [Opitutales bacterium]